MDKNMLSLLMKPLVANLVALILFFIPFLSSAGAGKALHKSEKLDSERLRNTPSGHEGKGKISRTPSGHEGKGKISRTSSGHEGKGKISRTSSGQGVKQPPQSPLSGGSSIPPCQGQEGKGQISLAQHDEREPFCHSEEQRDEESRGFAKVSLSGGSSIPPCQGGSGGLNTEEQRDEESRGCAKLLLVGGLEPLPELQKAVEKIRSLYKGQGLSVLADKEYQLRKYYYQIQSKTQKLTILEEVKGHFEKAIKKAEEKFDLGEEGVSQSAITKLKLGLAGTLNDIIELDSDMQVARLSLVGIFKDAYSPDAEMLNLDIEPVDFKFNDYDIWFEESGLAANKDELGLKTAYLKTVEAKAKLNLARKNRKITRALLVSEVANYDFGIGDSGDLFEALIIYTRVSGGYYDAVYNFNLAVAELNRVKAVWTGKP